MKTLPQINYLFSLLPITPTDNWFQTLNSLTTQFYWKNKKSRISLSTLQNSKPQGGLEAPNFLYYFLSNQLQYLLKWIHTDQSSPPWLQIEQNHCKTTSLSDLPFLPQSIKKQDYYNNITVSSTLTAWWKAHEITKSSLAPCRLSPMWHNPDFQLYNTPVYFPSWQHKGITHLHHLFENNQFISFNTLIQKYGVGRDQFLQYQQLKSIIKSKINTSNNILQSSYLSEEIFKITTPKKIISKMYKLFSLSETSITLPTTKWEKDLALPPNLDFWIQINKNIFSMTTNTNLQLIQYKTIHRIHITQGKMFKMGLISTDICSQCTLGHTDDYLHATWSCQPVLSFWITVTETLSCILGCRIPASPTLCLLGDLTHITIPTKHNNPLLISLTIAKKIIFQNWKSKHSCHIT
uniref:Reverse transcriptase zinc-binding domain-containing protein n=1 Tax=Sphaeramia orbicularis TaxID=375764 RepID=A0A672Z074_9TELE